MVEGKRKFDLDGLIEATVRDQDWNQRDLVETLVERTGRDERTIRNHLTALDGRTIKREREGRSVRVMSSERWGTRESGALTANVAHSQKVRNLVERFRDEIPLVDAFGAHRSPGSRAFPVSGSVEGYTPDQRLATEGHVLFDDLMFHLGFLGLQVNPSDAWPEFKRAVVGLLSAREPLWKLCRDEVGRVFRLPIGRSWSGDVVSESCVGALYEKAVARVAGERAGREPLIRTRLEVREAGDSLECWAGGVGLVRRQASKARGRDEFQLWVEGRLTRLDGANATKRFAEAAEAVNSALRFAQAVRQQLVGALEEAAYYEMYPGKCKFLAPSG